MSIAVFALLSCRGGKGYQSEERDSDLASLQDMWNRFNRSGCYDSLISVTDPYLEHFLECNDTSGIMYSGLAIAQAYVFKEESDSVKKYLALIEKYETEDMDPLVGILINNISGMNALKSGLDYSEALEYYSKGLDFAEKSGNSNNAVALLCNMVSIFYTLGDAGGYLYAERAMEISETAGTSAFMECMANISMAKMLSLKECHREAMQFAAHADSIANAEGYRALYPVLNLIYADSYSALGDVRKALECYQKAIGCSESAEPGTLSLIYMHFGDFYEKNGDRKAAIEMYRRGLDVSIAYGNMEFRKEILHKIADMYYTLGRYQDAVSYYRKYSSLLDSLSTHDNEIRFNELLRINQKMEYEGKLRDSELALLRERRKSETVIWSCIMIMVVSGFSIGIYLYRKRTSRKLVYQHRKYSRRIEKGMSAFSEQNREDSGQELYRRIEYLMETEKVFRMNDMSLDRLAEMTGSNRTYVSNMINRYSGMSYYNYIDTYRIRAATEILAERPDYPLKQLASDVGYNSASVFYKAFARETGCTPGQYRKTIEGMGAESFENP